LRSVIEPCLLDDRLTNRPNYTTVLSLARMLLLLPLLLPLLLLQLADSCSFLVPTLTHFLLLLLLLRQLQGSLRSAIDACLLDDRLTNRPNYTTVLSLALGVARAMAHLHSEGVIHGGGFIEGFFECLPRFICCQ
jgi:hypothetical protein